MTDLDKKEKLQGIDKEIADKTLNLKQLTAEVKSKERLLDELNKTKNPNSESVIEALHRQEDEILLRDKQIIVLNERISLLEKGEYAKLTAEKDRQIADLKNQIDSASKELAEEQAQSKENENLLSETKLKLAKRDHEYAELQEEHRKLEDQLKTHTEASERKTTEEVQTRDYESEIKALKEKITELQIEINIGDERYEKLNEKLSAFKRKKKEKENELRNVEDKLEEIQIKYNDTLLEIDTIKKSNPQTGIDISRRSSVGQGEKEINEAVNQQVQQLQAEIKKLQDKISDKDIEINKLTERNQNAHKENEAKDKTIFDLQHQLSKQHDHSGKSGDLNNELKNIIDDKNNEIERLQSLLESSESQNEDKMTLLIQQERKLRELEDTNSKLEELTVGLKEGLAQIQEKIMMTGDQMADLKQALSESEHHLREARQEKASMQKKLKETLLDNNDMKNIIGFKEAEISKKDQAAIKMMEEINLLRTRVKQASTKLNSIVDQQLKEHERKMKEKDTEIGVLKEMLKSSKTMLRYKEIEIEKMKKQFFNSEGDIKLPKIGQSPPKGTNRDIRNDFSLQNLHQGRIEPLLSAKSNQYAQNKTGGIQSPGYNDGRSHNELPLIPNHDQGSFFSNKNDKNKILPRELDDTTNFDGAERTFDNTEKKKKKSNNIFDPNAEVDFKPGDVKISPVKVTKKKKPENSRNEDLSQATPRNDAAIKTPKEGQTTNAIPSKNLDEKDKPKPPAEKKDAKKEGPKKETKKTVDPEDEASEENEEEEGEDKEEKEDGEDEEDEDEKEEKEEKDEEEEDEEKSEAEEEEEEAEDDKE